MKVIWEWITDLRGWKDLPGEFQSHQESSAQGTKSQEPTLWGRGDSPWGVRDVAAAVGGIVTKDLGF